MTAASTVQVSIGRSLLIQLCVIEVVSIIFFTRIGASVLGGIIAPLWGVALPFVALADWSTLPSAPGILIAGCIAVVLLAAGVIAWLRFGSRLAAHIVFALYSLFSMAMLLAFKWVSHLTNRWSQPLAAVLKGWRMNYEGWSESRACRRQRWLSSFSLDVVPYMNGRFPYDVFLIVLGPFVMIAVSLWLTPLLIPNHVHHSLAVVIALVFAAGLAIILLLFWIRRRGRRNTWHLTIRSSQPLAAVLKDEGWIMKYEVKVKLAPASGGSAPSR
jgi:hypothetical protein